NFSLTLLARMNRERRMLRNDRRVLRNFRQRNLDRFFELWISAGDYVGRSDLDVEVRSNAGVFDAPASTRIVRGAIRKSNLSAVDERRRKVVRTDTTTERALADEWTNLREFEHEGARLCG